MYNILMRNEELQISPGDAVVLTPAASISVMGDRDDGSGTVLVGLVIDELESWLDCNERVWGVLVNGQCHQVLSSEIDAVIRASR
jgi:hypothetical protein